MNTKQTEALKLALAALESCGAGDYSTGHVIHPSFDVDAVNRAIDAVDEALAEQPAQQQACDSKTGESETQSDLKFTGETQAQQQEPVAKSAANHKKGEVGFCEFLKDVPNGSVLYTSPQPTQQEPVGQLVEEVYGRGQVLWFDKPDDFSMLYTSPPPSKPWVGLTTEDRIDLYKETKWLELEDVIRLTDSKLREKNA